jgi:hypothetical protein
MLIASISFDQSRQKNSGRNKQRAEGIDEALAMSPSGVGKAPLLYLSAIGLWAAPAFGSRCIARRKFSSKFPHVYRAIASVRLGRCDNGHYTPPFGISQIIGYR